MLLLQFQLLLSAAPALPGRGSEVGAPGLKPWLTPTRLPLPPWPSDNDGKEYTGSKPDYTSVLMVRWNKKGNASQLSPATLCSHSSSSALLSTAAFTLSLSHRAAHLESARTLRKAASLTWSSR